METELNRVFGLGMSFQQLEISSAINLYRSESFCCIDQRNQICKLPEAVDWSQARGVRGIFLTTEAKMSYQFVCDHTNRVTRQ